ncbi:RNA polymerase II subunit A C-terminal domain phosphatase [Trichinella britovi]|uniref:Mitochondrial import inner membrane translocase subunit TIM50 n=1 Tax=Trichinella britovi TaxID=45882 RepID=A0A0V1C9K2_TRIBR|nr:RNA polymerase II subunit A C-terminal domain phosphatase [Trichinella britovi]
MDESNANKQETKKPEEEAGVSKVEEKKGKLNRLKKMWDGFIQRLCPRRTRNGVNSNSSSNDIPKLTVVFDLDSTLIYSTKKKQFSNQMWIDTIRHYVAIRPHCREVLQSVGEVANMMVYSAGTPKYVHHIVQLLDPEKTLFKTDAALIPTAQEALFQQFQHDVVKTIEITTGAKAALFRRAKDSNKQNRKQIIGRVAHAPNLNSHRINCGDHADA